MEGIGSSFDTFKPQLCPHGHSNWGHRLVHPMCDYLPFVEKVKAVMCVVFTFFLPFLFGWSVEGISFLCKNKGATLSRQEIEDIKSSVRANIVDTEDEIAAVRELYNQQYEALEGKMQELHDPVLYYNPWKDNEIVELYDKLIQTAFILSVNALEALKKEWQELLEKENTEDDDPLLVEGGDAHSTLSREVCVLPRVYQLTRCLHRYFPRDRMVAQVRADTFQWHEKYFSQFYQKDEKPYWWRCIYNTYCDMRQRIISDEAIPLYERSNVFVRATTPDISLEQHSKTQFQFLTI